MNGFIFGGFASASWDSTSKFKLDPNAFLFSLTNKDNKPCKMKIIESEHEYAIRCNSTHGPSFGVDEICIYASASSYSNLGAVYTHPQYAFGTNEAKSFLAGTQYFQLNEIEVYQKE